MKSPPFRRDAQTAFGYAGFGLYSFSVALLGPIVPLLRAELSLNYAVLGLHATVFALGAILVGIGGDRLTVALERTSVFRLGALGSGVAAALFIVARQSGLTLLAAALLGLGASAMLNSAQALLSDHQPRYRRAVLTEAGIVSSLSGSLAGFLIGALQRGGLGWRLALVLPVVGALALARWRLPEQQQAPRNQQERISLPPAFWSCWFLVLAVVTVEWGLSFWAAEYLTQSSGWTAGQAASFFGLYLLAMLAGRLLGGVLIRRTTLETTRLVGAALALAGAGFTLFWLTTSPWLQVGGLIVCGLGVANLYPLTLALALGSAPRSADLASARISLAVGLAILVAPLALGSLADALDLKLAYGLVPVALLLAYALVIRQK